MESFILLVLNFTSYTIQCQEITLNGKGNFCKSPSVLSPYNFFFISKAQENAYWVEMSI